METMILEAAYLAQLLHDGQFRRDGITPYIYHPMRVAGLATLYHLPTKYIAAAWLHDVLEDCSSKVTYLNLVDKFGHVVANTVSGLTNCYTHKNYPKLYRSERKLKEAQRLEQLSVEVQSIKLLDRIDNLMDLEEIRSENQFLRLYLGESITLYLLLDKAIPDVRNKLRSVIDNIERKL